ncbi:unnamed protein product [Aspergillus oryzae]|uniref:Unnamed protein product n=1 Tax=Aspergillus oryzae TaxID=5062 RepID=A0AAN5BSX5_ASPOZ|nr:unnamed protein product [Aspergillus oryzae]
MDLYKAVVLDLHLSPGLISAIHKPTVLVGIACALFFSQLLFWTAKYSHKKTKGLADLPGPSGWPLIGMGLDLPVRPRELLNRWAAQYGDVFKVRVGWYNWVFFNSPDAVKEVFDRQAAVTSGKPPLPIAQDYCLRGDGVLPMTYNAKWKRLHAFLKQLLSAKASAAFIPSQEFEIKQLLADLSHEAGKNSTDFYMHIRRMTFSIVMTSAYGLRIPKWDCQEVRDVYGNMRMLSIILSPGMFWIDGLEEETVSWLASAVPEAGPETTASALNGLIRYLAMFPDAQARAHDEVTRVLGDTRMATLADEPNMPYIRAVIKETLPTVPRRHDRSAAHGRRGRPLPGPPHSQGHHSAGEPQHPALGPRALSPPVPLQARAVPQPPASFRRNGLFLAVANITWAYEFKLPLDDQGEEIPLDITDEGFMEGAIRVPKQYTVRILERNAARSRLIRSEWDQAQQAGYVLRGSHVDVNGGVGGGSKTAAS